MAKGTSRVSAAPTVGGLVSEVAWRLSEAADVVNAQHEANDLVAALHGVPRHWPMLHENDGVESAVWRRACIAADARASGAPLAYAVGRADFRALTLDVDERVLIPRPETELLVDLAIARCAPGGVAVDVGTGSGAIAIALAMEGRFDRVIATDISTDALVVARANAERCGARVDFMAGNLLAALDADRSMVAPGRRASKVAAVVSNPPYISFAEIDQLPKSVRNWEPAVALLSEGDGLAVTARLVSQAAHRLSPGGLLALEVDARRASLVAEMVVSHGRYREVSVQLDLAGRERFVLATRSEGEHA